ncbi:NAD(P)H-hydrate epimerase [[Clostridium] ultunense Esp]|uniref:NAD(P)H-hydrate epimerase n=1 Tax=[Clostridium] ultunense Esp TaxID=1288971 RepID=M1Z1A9_9FIRM|nr:NAD(P)H-hydrate epimerase [Schnuerera ultunensis]CCQ96655.1 NAD(P)H-hydrate epimerase [[Clostridium] ultunense Esp]SHD77493.1 NAD(P)H-hydrate epimerase [[Clostridium] ultunense Esp]
MFAISCSEMKAMDSYAINNIGIPSIILMENAALKVLKNMDLDKTDSFTLVCGVGNNGGDGLAIARHLILTNKAIDLFIIGNLDKGTKDFNINLNILNNLGINFTHITRDEDLDRLKDSINSNDLTIDSIFGIGITREVEGLFRKTIDTLNKYSKDILSVDIPSGLDGDTGKILGISVKAKKTVTFHHMKKGLMENREYTGDVIVEDIGIPDKATKMVLEIL